jgi:hypothetical protein
MLRLCLSSLATQDVMKDDTTQPGGMEATRNHLCEYAYGLKLQHMEQVGRGQHGLNICVSLPFLDT